MSTQLRGGIEEYVPALRSVNQRYERKKNTGHHFKEKHLSCIFPFFTGAKATLSKYLPTSEPCLYQPNH